MAANKATIETLEADNERLQARIKYLRSMIRRYGNSAHVCGPRCGMPTCILERKIERLRNVMLLVLEEQGRNLLKGTLGQIAAAMEATDDFIPSYAPPIDLPEYVLRAKASDADASDNNIENPDLRIRSAGAAGVYGFQPLTPAGWRFVEGFSATTDRGRWSGGAFWFPDSMFPSEFPAEADLKVVAGAGSGPENDQPWTRRER